jgi:hypothetical protein
MKHDKRLDQEPTHQVITVEEDGREPQVLFEGSKRECESWIRIDGRITLTIKEL